MCCSPDVPNVKPRRRGLPVAVCLLLLLLATRREAVASPFPDPATAVPQVAASPERRVYVPHNVPGNQATIFWFGRVTPSENYAEARIRTTDRSLLVNLAIIDRRLWYDPNSAPAELTAGDAVSLYLRPGGATGERPDTGSYRFDATLSWWEPDRDKFQAAYQGDGSGWAPAPLPFATAADWQGTAPNNTTDDHGWMLTYEIPFTSLGLGAPPPPGTVWGLALEVHDRDGPDGPQPPAQMWPETLEPVRPVTWGQLIFGLKPPYVPLPSQPRATAIIRHGLNGARVIDADVGGSSECGAAASVNYFRDWGNLNYAGKTFLNIQRVDPISEWPCFSKYYVTFPLDSVPDGKVVLSATLTLYQSGHAGEGETPGPQPSLIQVYTIDEAWEESTLTWNNAPPAGEYVTATWVDPLVSAPPPWPGIPRHWEVGGAVAEAHAAGTPLRLALYTPASAFHSGKYFFSSNIGGDGEGRPTLTIVWGDPAASLSKAARPRVAAVADSITYTLEITGDGSPLTLTDSLPPGVGAPRDWSVTGTTVLPTYDGTTHRITWSDRPAAGATVTLSYQTPVTAPSLATLTNAATLSSPDGIIDKASITVLANPLRITLPLILRQR